MFIFATRSVGATERVAFFAIMKQTEEKIEKEDYDAEPVAYCARCYSLYILTDKVFGDYCGRCKSSCINTAKNYDEFDKIYKEHIKQIQEKR